MVDTLKAKTALAKTKVKVMSKQVVEVRQNLSIMHEALTTIMKKDTHYGVIPGCKKPSLYKSGAEVIMALFRLSSDPEVTDLSKDGEIRYLVKVHIKAKDGTFVGSGIGECSSGEEKYMWRVALCDDEFESFAETMRRIKFKKNNFTQKIDQIKQVRVPPSDLANTILKMAKKRGLIDGVLTATGASDIFSQDIEDLPEEYVEFAKEDAKPSPEGPVSPPDSSKAEQSPEQPPQGSPESLEIENAPVGSLIPEVVGLVMEANVREKMGKLKDKSMTTYKVKLDSEAIFLIQRWGGLHEGSLGQLCLFKNVKVAEFQGEKQYLAQEIESQ
jgi:hypothetical protein